MRVLSLIAVSATLTGCFGDSFLDFNQLPSGTTPPPDDVVDPVPPETIGDVNVTACQPVKAGPTAFRRLTREEYKLTVNALLGDTAAEADAFIEDGLLHGFRNNHYAATSPLVLN